MWVTTLSMVWLSYNFLTIYWEWCLTILGFLFLTTYWRLCDHPGIAVFYHTFYGMTIQFWQSTGNGVWPSWDNGWPYFGWFCFNWVFYLNWSLTLKTKSCLNASFTGCGLLTVFFSVPFLIVCFFICVCVRVDVCVFVCVCVCVYNDNASPRNIILIIRGGDPCHNHNYRGCLLG